MKKAQTFSIVIALLFLVACSEKSNEKQEVPKPIVGEVISEDGVRIVYEKHGAGVPVLVFVHGWSCDRSYWDQQIDHFSGKHTIVLIDLAGHGQSGRERTVYSMERFGADVAAVVDQLELNEVFLIGHSMGGSVILEAARRLPGRVVALVGADTYQRLDDQWSEENVRNWIEPFHENFHGATINLVQGMFTAEADSVLAMRIAEDMASAPPEVALSAFEQLFLYNAAVASDKIDLPMHLINSSKYEVDTLALKRHTPRYSLQIMEDVGHFVMLENPTGFNKRLERILK